MSTTYTVKGGNTTADDPIYEAGAHYEDTVYNIAKAMQAAGDKRSEEVIIREIARINHLKTRNGQRCTDKTPMKDIRIHVGQVLTLNIDKEIHPELFYECPKKKPQRAAAPAQPEGVTPPPAAAAPPQPEDPNARVVAPQAWLNRATPAAAGRFVTPETAHAAYGLYADVGGNQRFTYQWYKLEDFAARIPAIFERHTGQRIGDFAMVGPHIGSNRQSRVDDFMRQQDMRGGSRQRAFISGYVEATLVEVNGKKYFEFTDPENREKPPVRIAFDEFMRDEPAHLRNPDLFPVGTRVRYNRGISERAHGSDMIVANLMPVGTLLTPPAIQTPFDARQSRFFGEYTDANGNKIIRSGGGITQNQLVLSWEDYIGRDTFFRDTQAAYSTPLETSDRIEAQAVQMSWQRDFARSMAAFPTAATPEEKQKLALTALTAWRDMDRNRLIHQVDSMRLPNAAKLEALRSYFRAEGVNMEAVDAQLRTANPLPIRYMDREVLATLQDANMQGNISTNPQHMAIKPGGVIEGSDAAIDRVLHGRRTERGYELIGQNYAEARIAKVQGRERSQAEMTADSQAAWQSILYNANGQPNAGAISAIGRSMQNPMNYEVATEFGEALTDFTRNPELYGFANAQEARNYVAQFANGNAQALAQLGIASPGVQPHDGKTVFNQYLPIPGNDRPHNMDNPRLFGAQAGAVAQANPTLFADAMTRMSRVNPDKPDGRLGGIAMLRALAAEPAQREGEFGPTFQAVIASGIQNPEKVKQTLVDAAVYSRLGVSGISVNGFNRLDNLYTAAQYGAMAAQGRPYMVATDAEVQSGEANRQAARLFPGQTPVIFNTGAVNGQGAYQAARSGNNQAIYNELYRSPEAVSMLSTQVGVESLIPRPALARDAVFLAMVKNPQSMDNVIASLNALQSKGQRYHALADALKDTRERLIRYQQTRNSDDLQAAGLRFADFQSDMERNASSNGGAWRDNAWQAAITAIGNDQKASAAVLDAIGSDALMRDALLTGAPQALVALDNARGTNRGKMGQGNQLPANIRGDSVYAESRFTNTLAENRFKETVNVDAVLQALGGAAARPQAAGASGEPPAGQPSRLPASPAARPVVPAVPTVPNATVSGVPSAQDIAAVTALNSKPNTERGAALDAWIVAHTADASGRTPANSGLVINGALSPAQKQMLVNAISAPNSSNAVVHALSNLGNAREVAALAAAAGVPAAGAPAAGAPAAGAPAAGAPAAGAPAAGVPAGRAPAAGTQAAGTTARVAAIGATLAGQVTTGNPSVLGVEGPALLMPSAIAAGQTPTQALAAQLMAGIAASGKPIPADVLSGAAAAMGVPAAAIAGMTPAQQAEVVAGSMLKNGTVVTAAGLVAGMNAGSVGSNASLATAGQIGAAPSPIAKIWLTALIALKKPGTPDSPVMGGVVGNCTACQTTPQDTQFINTILGSVRTPGVAIPG